MSHLCCAPGKCHFRVTHWANVYQCDNCHTGAVKPADAPNRIGCCIPFCRSTRGDRKGDPITENMEWICSKHWAMVPTRLKHLRSSARRRGKIPLEQWLWQRCKTAAIERAAGI